MPKDFPKDGEKSPAKGQESLSGLLLGLSVVLGSAEINAGGRVRGQLHP